MINSVVLEGYLFKDLSELEVIKTSNGKDMLSFAFMLANANKDDTNKVFVNCIAFDKTAQYLTNYGYKGTRIFVKGSITSKKDKDGKQTSLSVLVNDVSLIQKERFENGGNKEQDNEPNPYAKKPKQEIKLDFNDNDLPF